MRYEREAMFFASAIVKLVMNRLHDVRGIYSKRCLFLFEVAILVVCLLQTGFCVPEYGVAGVLIKTEFCEPGLACHSEIVDAVIGKRRF